MSVWFTLIIITQYNKAFHALFITIALLNVTSLVVPMNNC